MDYAQAKKAVQAHKPRENFILVKLDYETFLVLPHKAGLAFVEAISNAEMLTTPYSKPHRISELTSGKFEISTLSGEEYERHKIATLLGVSLEDLKQYEQPALAAT